MCKKVYYRHFIKTVKNLDNVTPYPEPKNYGADFISGNERSQFLEWYEMQTDKHFPK